MQALQHGKPGGFVGRNQFSQRLALAAGNERDSYNMTGRKSLPRPSKISAHTHQAWRLLCGRQLRICIAAHHRALTFKRVGACPTHHGVEQGFLVPEVVKGQPLWYACCTSSDVHAW